MTARRRTPAYEPHARISEPLHPEWLDQRVPNGFWTDRTNHRRYMLWLRRQLGYRRWEDWYRIRCRDFHNNRGGTLLTNYYGACAVRAVVANLPEYDWHEWLFRIAPNGFWDDPANRRRYMQWLGGRLGFSRPEDWYQVTHQHFRRNHGGGFLWSAYDNSPIAAVKDHWPEYDWHEWLFHIVPNGFWGDPANRRRYAEWLGQQLGYRCPEDWYQVNLTTIHAHRGGGLAVRYRNSPAALVMDCFPEHDWRRELFRPGNSGGARAAPRQRSPRPESETHH